MKANNIEQKATEDSGAWSLTELALPYIDNSEEFRFSRHYGKETPLIVRIFEGLTYPVLNFFADLFVASKVIIRELM